MDGFVKGIHVTTCNVEAPINAHIQVFRIAYCDLYEPSKEEECTEICSKFVEAVYQHKSEMMKKQKVHLILHLVECMNRFGPTSSFNSERYVTCDNFIFYD